MAEFLWVAGLALVAMVMAIIWRETFAVRLLCLLFLLSLVFLPLWFFGLMIVSFTRHPDMYAVLWSVGLLGAMIRLVTLKLKCPKVKLIAGLLVLACPLGFICGWQYDWWTKDRFPRLDKRIDWRQYEPFAPSNRLVSVEAPAEYRLNQTDHLLIHCAYALQPIGAAAVQALCADEGIGANQFVKPVSSPQAYRCLRYYIGDAILALAPSTNQLAQAEACGVTYDLTPVARDAFVFFVPVSNPVESLTLEQLRGIYSGRITSWRELGVPIDAKLRAFQRNQDSGSQTAFEWMMGDVPIMPPLKENHVGSMGGVVNRTANFRSYPGAIGFSFRYYVQELLEEKGVKLLKIDGVEPTVENIRSGMYPLIETSYVVTVRERKESVDRFIRFLTSPFGREMIERIGYVAP